MKMKPKEKSSCFLKYLIPTIAGFSVIVCILEGYFYYSLSEKNLYVQMLLNMQNTFKAFLFSPYISIQDAKKVIRLDTSFVKIIVCYLYITVLILAPICSAVALLKAIEKSVRGWGNIIKQTLSKKIFVFGYNKHSKEFLKNLVDNGKKVILVTQNTLMDNEKLELLRKGVVVLQGDFSKGRDIDIKYSYRKMKIEKAESIILFEEVATSNFSILLNIVEYYDSIDKKNVIFKRIKDDVIYINCSISCDDYGTQEIITDYYDRYIDEISQKNYKRIQIDLKIFSIPEIQARELFSYKPIYLYNLKNTQIYTKEHHQWELSENEYINPWDTHLIIVGFGKLGQNVLLQAINLGNLQSKSTITIDVFDKNVDEKKGIFAKRFSHENVQINEEFILFPKESRSSDGKVIIRFHKTDIRTIDFEDKLNELKNITYVAICFDDSSLSTMSMVTVSNKFKNIPIAVQMDVDKKVIDYIKKNNKSYKEVFPFGNLRDVLNKDFIIENDIDKQAILYNAKYNEYCNFNVETSEKGINSISHEEIEAWNRMILLKKNSSRKLIEHENIKIILLFVDSWIKQGYKVKNIIEKVTLLLDCLENHDKYEADNVKQIHDYLYDEYKKISNGKVEKILSYDKTIEELAALEHRRWCNFMFTNGYKYKDCKKDDSVKTNPCLLSWNELCMKLPEMLVYDVLGILICAERMKDGSIKFIY